MWDLHYGSGCGQVDIGEVLHELSTSGHDDLAARVRRHVGSTGVVTPEDLKHAGVPNRLVYELRRRLDPRWVSAAFAVWTRVYVQWQWPYDSARPHDSAGRGGPITVWFCPPRSCRTLTPVPSSGVAVSTWSIASCLL